MRELLHGQVVSSSLVALHLAAGLPESSVLSSSVVFVANPNADMSCGTAVGTTNVFEIDPKSPPAQQTGIVMHEIAHLAVAASPRTKEIEPALVGEWPPSSHPKRAKRRLVPWRGSIARGMVEALPMSRMCDA